ncbi:MAG: signal peptide peptidase SppA [Pirellulales bacterium]|nr:signal peptide peptidase SppA [Pirellulales bacterium]
MTPNRHLAAWMMVCLLLGCFLLGPALAADPAKSPDAKAATAKKVEPKKADATKPKAKKAALKKEPAEAKPKAPKPKAAKAQPKKTEPKKAEPKKPDVAKAEPKKAEPSKPAPKSKGAYLSRLLRKTTQKVAAKEEKPEQKAPEKKTAAKDTKKTAAKETKKPGSKPAVVSTKRPVVVHLTLRGDYPEGPSTSGPFGEMKPSLGTLIEKFDALAEDKNVDAVVVEMENLELGGGKVNEVRQAIQRVRAGGKPVTALLTAADPGNYLIACACDEIVMAPSGMLVIPGVRAEVTFYKGLLDKIGVKADMIQMGKYKGAGEPYTRTGMSPPLRESFEAVVDDSYERLVAVVAKDRKLKDYKVKTLIDQGLFTASQAKKAGLVDRLLYTDQVFDELCRRFKASGVRVVTKYKNKGDAKEFSGVTGMMKLLQILVGGQPERISRTSKKVAVVYAVGPIIQGKSASGLFSGDALGSTTMVKTLREAAKDPTVVAIVLRIDSPGGSAIASDLIWREIVRIKKPVIASMGDVAGSGGYYIAMGADRIYAEPSTLTGSIGVIGGKMVTRGLYRKIGLSTTVISRGQNSGIFSSDQPFTPSERDAWVTSMKETYHQFVAKSAKGRKMKFDELEALAQGRIYSGSMAADNGLVDRIGTLHDAIAQAKKMAGVKKGQKIEILVLPKPKSLFEELFGDPSASMSEEARTAAKLLGPLADVELLQRLFAEPILTIMPYRVEMK